jgi:hypothetical protein
MVDIRHDHDGTWLELGPSEYAPLEPGVLIEWGATRRFFPDSLYTWVLRRAGHLDLWLRRDRGNQAQFDLQKCTATLIQESKGQLTFQELTPYDEPTRTQTGDGDVTMEIENRAEVLRREAARLLALAERMDVPQPSKSNTVVRWVRRFDRDSRAFNYAAIKVGRGRSALWYVTGRRTPGPYTWEALVESHLMHAVPGSVEVSSKWSRLDMP